MSAASAAPHGSAEAARDRCSASHARKTSPRAHTRAHTHTHAHTRLALMEANVSALRSAGLQEQKARGGVDSQVGCEHAQVARWLPEPQVGAVQPVQTPVHLAPAAAGAASSSLRLLGAPRRGREDSDRGQESHEPRHVLQLAPPSLNADGPDEYKKSKDW